MKERIIRDPNYVKIFDTTLRDGFQSPGVTVGPEDRLKVARLLTKMRIDIAEVGFPTSSQERFETVREAALALDDMTICALTRANPADIEKTWEAIEPAKDKGGARLHVFIGTSPDHLKDNVKKDEKEVLAAIREAIRIARGFTNDVEFSAEDSTRSDFNFLMRAVLEAVDAGATTINLPDTVGYMKPPEYARMIARAKRRIDQYIGKDQVIVSVHCHNDLGSAVDNSLEGTRIGGARQIEAAVNGIGERAGNAALEEIIANLLSRPDYYRVNGKPLLTGVDPLFTYELSEFVEEVSSMLIQPNKAVVGANAFAHESGIHAAAVIRNKKTYEFLDSTMFGERVTKIVIGGESGHASVENQAKELGIKLKDPIGLTQIIKDYGNLVRREVTHTEFERIAAEFNHEDLTDRFILKNVEAYGSDHSSNSRVNILIDGEPHQVEAIGKGPIESAVCAIKEATGLNIDIADFTGKSLGEGANAKAGVNLTIQNGIRITAYAEDTSVPLAAIKAYVAALNTMNRSEQRKKKE